MFPAGHASEDGFRMQLGVLKPLLSHRDNLCLHRELVEARLYVITPDRRCCCSRVQIEILK